MATPFIQPLCYYSHFILAHTKVQSFSYLKNHSLLSKVSLLIQAEFAAKW